MLQIFLYLLLLPAHAEQKTLNLGLAPAKTPTIEADVNTSEVEVNGTRYIKIQMGGGALLIPKLDVYTPQDFDAAFCGSQMGINIKRETMVAQIETKLSPTLKAYSGLIVDTLRHKCDGTPQRVVPSPRVEFGITYQPEGSKNKNLKYRGFVTPKGLGVGADF